MRDFRMDPADDRVVSRLALAARSACAACIPVVHYWMRLICLIFDCNLPIPYHAY